MKKYIAFLLCLVTIISMFSCSSNNINEKENDHTNNNTTDEITSDNPSQENVADYSKILNMYRSIIEILPNYVDSKEAMDNCCAELSIVDEKEKELFEEIFWSTFDFKKSPPYKLSCGYAMKDLNGDGVDELVLLNNEYYIMAIFSYADGKPVLLGNYMPRGSCWIDGDGLLHENGSGGADHSTHAIYKIADGGKELELIVEYGTNGHEWIEDVAYTIYYKLVNGEKKTITEAEYQALNEQYGKYLGSVAGAEATKKHSGLTFTSLYTEAEIAMEMYEAAINDKICVIDEHLGEIKLKACRFPSNNARIDECKLLTKAILDLDGDGINEYVIQSPDKDHIVLHYYNGKVYSYGFDNSRFHNLNTDGSFYWRDSYGSKNWTRGLNQITFDRSSLSIKEIYRIKTISPPDDINEYYMGGEQISRGEYLEYYNHNYKTRMSFSPFELTCSYPITAEQAWNLANTYWNNVDGLREGAAGTTIVHKVALLSKPSNDSTYYHIGWQLESCSHFYDGWESLLPKIETYKEVYINAFTGEFREYIDTVPEGKG